MNGILEVGLASIRIKSLGNKTPVFLLSISALFIGMGQLVAISEEAPAPHSKFSNAKLTGLPTAAAESGRLDIILHAIQENWADSTNIDALKIQINRMMRLDDESRAAVFRWFFGSNCKPEEDIRSIHFFYDSVRTYYNEMVNCNLSSGVGELPGRPSMQLGNPYPNVESLKCAAQLEVALFYFFYLKKGLEQKFECCEDDLISRFKMTNKNKADWGIEIWLGNVYYFVQRYCTTLVARKYVYFRVALIPQSKRFLETFEKVAKAAEEGEMVREQAKESTFIRSCIELHERISKVDADKLNFQEIFSQAFADVNPQMNQLGYMAAETAVINLSKFGLRDKAIEYLESKGQRTEAEQKKLDSLKYNEFTTIGPINEYLDF